ncbi:hypothetical protein DSL72_004617 [Monilinia vaccinii-corymbosi]|uniref:RhoGAP-domain-containing protein n=1 Tax=Monilinia vaccinii-corymbosi TaxID=61207 RepID=A0A8A3P9X5_9HELO|nr:hypothetical protein DSL72_004617 [Monilinia vaccinii-corymbosi]
MSQLSQQAERPFNTHYLPQESPTAGRTQLLHSANSSLPVSETCNRSLRKAAPSPLHTSTTPRSSSSSVTPTRATFHTRGSENPHTFTSTNASQSPLEEPRSPKERLDDLLATEKDFYTSEQSIKPPQIQGTSRFGRPLQEAESNAPTRSASDSVLANVGSTSPPDKTPTMATTVPAHRVGMGRPPPRTSSIDSAISSISSGGHSYKNSQDSKGSSPQFDIAQLIQAAGSPEAAIQYLIKEKQSQTAQNSQLWRLVDKQRAMILGLNKDLERALKDKERYRKKFKENATQNSHPSPVDSTQGPMSESGSVTSEPRVVEISAQKGIDGYLNSDGSSKDGSNAQNSPMDVALALYADTPPAMGTLSNMVAPGHKMPLPTKHAFQQYSPDSPHLGFEASQLQRQDQAVATDTPRDATVPASRNLPSDSPRGPPPSSPPPLPTSSQGPPSALVESSPKVDRGPPKFPPPRKAPPAPLNLGKILGPSTHLRQASEAKEETDSDYEDLLEVEEIPTFIERGRRKTREEDDRVREIVAAQDAEARSLSKKSPKGSVQGTPKSNTPKEVIPAMPLSSRPTVQLSRPNTKISSPGAQLLTLRSQDESTGSLAEILSASASLRMKSTTVSPRLMSPGLPRSPRPILSPSMATSAPSSIASPLSSARGMVSSPGAVPLTPRAPRQPIPLPPGTTMSISSPPPRAEPLVLVSPQPLVITKRSEETLNTLKSEETLVNESIHERLLSDSPTSSHSGDVIYKGLVTEEYPDLLLPPNALPSIDVKVASSRLKPSRASNMFPANPETDPVFTLAIFARSDGKELWRVEKDSASLAHLDQILKQCPTFSAKTPDKNLFNGHSPAKIDARRTALDNYLDEVLNTELDTESALEICRYLSTNAMEPNADDITPGSDTGSESPAKTGPGGRPVKNGYLTKKGKNFGGWKSRFFVLDGPVFRYYESPGGQHLGGIKLQNAQIGKQSQQADDSSPSRDSEDADNQYRHAFLIMEPKSKDASSLVRHVLCAESDKERDEWVEALLRYVDYKDESSSHTRSGSSISHPHARRKGNRPGKLGESSNDLRAVGYDAAKQGAVPHGARSKTLSTPSPPTHGHERDPMLLPQSQSMRSISGPKNPHPIQDAGSWGNKPGPSAPDEKVKQKKRSFFGFGSRPRPSVDLQDISANVPIHNLSQMAHDQHGPIRPVFGAPLAEAVRYNHPVDVQVKLPAVIYRCIEYLDAKNAAGEEGIFRLSGSNIVIRQLRERFNVEGDVNLVTDDQYYDIHAVASLLKLYLRELPSTILTRELHLEFIAVTELRDMNEKVSALNGLVHRLPRANHTLLRYLSGFLINIINHSDTNKMTVRNVGIVFSPTLNIPAPVFALFLQQYEGIFERDPDDHEHRPVEVTVTAPALSPEDIRSPRRQKFQQDLPTPSFSQQSFGQQGPGFAGLNTMAAPEYGGRANSPRGPFVDQQYPASKTSRRESSLFNMGMGLGQKRSTNRMRQNDPHLIDEETLFD